MATLSELDSGFISGTCDAMCPAAEKEERVDRNLVHVRQTHATEKCGQGQKNDS